MKILIVDDDGRRSSSLKKFIAEKCLIHDEDIRLASCLNEARTYLRAMYFDVLILDVVLPKRADKLSPDPSVGIGLLMELNRESYLKKPERIIGITAHLDDANKFRNEFEKSCNIVVEAPSNSDLWKARIVSSLQYTGISKTSRAVHEAKTAVLSVHGIRTFGQWQARLRKLLEERTEGITFHNYKFGYFSSLVFIFPFFRRMQISRLQKDIERKLVDKEFDRIYIFCHSFGTYLVVKCLENIFNKKNIKGNIVLILSGSVLHSDYNWRAIDRGGRLRIINECGSKDHILWLSAAFVYGMGMAGKSGFYGFNDEFLMNRFYSGGHSLYFNGDDFMLRQWLPLFDQPPMISEIDERTNYGLIYGLLEKTVILLASVKHLAYLAIILFIIYKVLFHII